MIDLHTASGQHILMRHNAGHDCFQLCPVFIYLSIISFSRYGWITLPLVAFRVQWVSIVAVVSYCLGFDSLWMIFLAMKKVSIGSIQSIHCIGKNKSFAILLLIIGRNTCNLLIEQNFYVSEHFTKWNYSDIKRKNIINRKTNPMLMMFLFLLLLGTYCIRLSKEYANNAFSNT